MRLGGHPQPILGSPAWAWESKDFLFHKVPLGQLGPDLSQDIPSLSETEEEPQRGAGD